MVLVGTGVSPAVVPANAASARPGLDNAHSWECTSVRDDQHGKTSSASTPFPILRMRLVCEMQPHARASDDWESTAEYWGVSRLTP